LRGGGGEEVRLKKRSVRGKKERLIARTAGHPRFPLSRPRKGRKGGGCSTADGPFFFCRAGLYRRRSSKRIGYYLNPLKWKEKKRGRGGRCPSSRPFFGSLKTGEQQAAASDVPQSSLKRKGKKEEIANTLTSSMGKGDGEPFFLHLFRKRRIGTSPSYH